MSDSVNLITNEEIRNMETNNPGYMAMSMLLHKSFDSEDILDDVEFLNLKNSDYRFKKLCEMLLDPHDPEKGTALPLTTVTSAENKTRLTMKQKLSIELDRAMMWKGHYNHNRSMIF